MHYIIWDVWSKNDRGIMFVKFWFLVIAVEIKSSRKMRQLSIKDIAQGRSRFIPDAKALNGLNKSSGEGISFGLTAKKKKKSVVQAYFKPLRSKVSCCPIPLPPICQRVCSIHWLPNSRLGCGFKVPWRANVSFSLVTCLCEPAGPAGFFSARV